MNSSKAKLVAVLISVVFSIGLSQCKGQVAKKKASATNKNNPDSVIVVDSLKVDLDTDGDSDKIEVIELVQKRANRLIQIKMAEDRKYNLSARNDSLIACATCGYQGGDDFTSLDETEDGFVLNFWRSSIFFNYKHGAVYLKKIEILDVKQTPEKLIEKRKIYTTQDFGKIPFTEVGIHLKMLPKDQ